MWYARITTCLSTFRVDSFYIFVQALSSLRVSATRYRFLLFSLPDHWPPSLPLAKVMAATLAAGRDYIVAGIPVGRIGEPSDVAGTCIFLSSRAGSFVNGCVVLVLGSLVHADSSNTSATIPLEGGLLVAGKL